jgi:hypothetical protein
LDKIIAAVSHLKAPFVASASRRFPVPKRLAAIATHTLASSSACWLERRCRDNFFLALQRHAPINWLSALTSAAEIWTTVALLLAIAVAIASFGTATFKEDSAAETTVMTLVFTCGPLGAAIFDV